MVSATRGCVLIIQPRGTAVDQRRGFDHLTCRGRVMQRNIALSCSRHAKRCPVLTITQEPSVFYDSSACVEMRRPPSDAATAGIEDKAHFGLSPSSIRWTWSRRHAGALRGVGGASPSEASLRGPVSTFGRCSPIRLTNLGVRRTTSRSSAMRRTSRHSSRARRRITRFWTHSNWPIVGPRIGFLTSPRPAPNTNMGCADELTTALDATVQRQILLLLRKNSGDPDRPFATMAAAVVVAAWSGRTIAAQEG
jgi:hypothetical protein